MYTDDLTNPINVTSGSAGQTPAPQPTPISVPSKGGENIQVTMEALEEQRQNIKAEAVKKPEVYATPEKPTSPEKKEALPTPEKPKTAETPQQPTTTQPIIPPTKPDKPKHVVNEMHHKVKLHEVDKTADPLTQKADLEEEDFITKVEETHATN